MKIPASEKITTAYLFEGVKEYVVAQNILQGKFTLYKIVDNGYERIKVSNSPADFHEIAKQDRSKQYD